MSGGGTEPRRVVVVGASAGIGRAFARDAARAGWDVVFAARRLDALQAAVSEAGGGTAIAVDVCDPDSRARLVQEVAGGGAVDLVLITVGVADLRPLADTGEAEWNRTLGTNLVGVARLIDGFLPALADGAIVAVTSTEAVRLPRSGLVPYAASKAALEAMLTGFRVEHPGVRISCVAVGSTIPTEFGAAFEPERLLPALQDWQRHGRMQQEFMATDDVAAVLLGIFDVALRHPGVGVDDLLLRSPSGLAPT